MLDFDRYQQENNIHVVRIFKERPDAVVALMARNNGELFVCRIYDHPVYGYEAAWGLDVSELPAVYRYTTVDGCWVVEEEFVDGIRLSELLEVYRPDESQTSAITERLCRALSALHEKGIIHRDVKPENVLITSAGRVVLIDLDAVSHLDAGKNRDTRLLGTVGYAAPEQFGFGRSDMRTDIFGLGVLINTMLTGEHPSQKLAEGPLRPIIERCIAVNADQRYRSAEILRQALLPFAGEAVVCPECGFVSPGGGCLCCGKPAESGKRKNRHLLWVAMAAAVLALLGLVLFLVLQNRDEPDISHIQTAFEKYPVDIIYDQDGNFHFPADMSPMPAAFTYDLDGDGEEETYYFGTLQNVEKEPVYSMWDSVGRPYDESDRIYRTAAPAVFAKDSAGKYTPVKEFADLIQDPDITVYYIDLMFGDKSAMPVLTSAAPLYGVWRGAETIEYSIGCIGAWVIEASCLIDGERYTAFTLAEIRTDWNGIPLDETLFDP